MHLFVDIAGICFESDIFMFELKGEVLDLFNHFFESAEFEHKFFSSFMSLIPKVSCSLSLNDFRLISLLGWVHKLVTWVLVARLRRVMGKLVRDSQTVFIRGISIFEGWTVALKVPNGMKRYGEGLAFKIDIEKVYDCMDWCFLWFILVKIGFGEKCINSMNRCVSCVRVLVLVNGSASDKFMMERGLRKACSLSPLLFNLVAESLSLVGTSLKIFIGCRAYMPMVCMKEPSSSNMRTILLCF